MQTDGLQPQEGQEVQDSLRLADFYEDDMKGLQVPPLTQGTSGLVQETPALPFPDAPAAPVVQDKEEERRKRLELFLQIPLYDADSSVREAVDASPEFRIYGGKQKALRSPGAYHIYGKDLARLMAPGMLNNPLELVQRSIEGIADDAERQAWQAQFDELRASGKDDARSYFALFGRMTWEKVQGEYARHREEQRRQQEIYDDNQYRVQGMIQRSLDGFEDELTPEDMQLLRDSGVEWEDVEACSKAMRFLGYPYSTPGFDAAITSETARNVYGVLKDRPKARALLMQQLAAKGRSGDAGAFGALMEGIVSFGENAKEALNHYHLAEVLPQSEESLRKSLHQQGMEYLDRALDDDPELAEDEARCNEIYMQPFRQYEENSAVAALWGEMKGAVESGRAENTDVLGLTMKEAGSGAAFMLRLMPWIRGLNVLSGAAGARQQVAMKARQEGMDMGDMSIGAQSGAYGLIESASMLGAPAGVYGALGKATANTALGARYALFAARPAGALAVNSVRGTLDATLIIPGVMGGLKSLYDVSPWNGDDRLNSGLEELAALQAQLADPKHLVAMAANGIMFAGVGARHIQGRAAQSLQGYAEHRVMRMNGLTEKQCKDIARLPARERMAAMEKAIHENVQSDPEGNLRRAIEACRGELDRRQAQEMRADNAVAAALEARGYSLRPSDEAGKVWVHTDGTMNPEDGTFSPGEKKFLLSQEDADVFVQVIMRRELEQTAAAMRGETGKARLLDAFTDKLKGKARVHIMPRAETMEGLKRKAAQAEERAAERARELAEQGEGMPHEEAHARALAEIHPDIDERPLGEVIQTSRDMGARLELERARGGDGVGSRAYVTTYRKPDGRVAERVLRIALDDRNLTMHEVAEEVGEQIAKDWMEDNGMDYADAYRALRELQQEMERHPDAETRKAAGSFLSLQKLNEGLEARLMGERREKAVDMTVDEEAQVRREVVEAISKLMRSDLISSASDRQGDFPAWARGLFDQTTLSMAELPQQVAMARALANARAEGWMPEAARTLLGVAPQAVEKALRRQAEPTVEEYRRDWFNRQRRQAELDAAFGEGVLRDPEATERFEAGCREGQEMRDKAREAQTQEDYATAKEHVAELEQENPGMTHEEVVKTAAEKAADAKETELANDPAAQQDAAFSGGRYVEIPDEGGLAVKAGMVPVEGLEVLPNFKLGADPQTGVVHPLAGDYYSTHDPIRAMRMKDGRIVVFSGRHRLDACRRAGVSRIMAYLYEETPARGEAWMRRYDIESNIRDNQATPLEVALYVRGEFTEGRTLSDDEAARAGIDRAGSLGAMGYRIGRNAGGSVIDALRNGRIDDRTALWIADFCPGNEAVQRRGLERALDGASKGEILARMEAELALKAMQGELGIEGTTDLFGNAIDNDGFMDFVAQYVNRKRNELAKDIAYLRTNAGKRNSQAMAEKYGIRVDDAEGLKKQLAEMQALQDRWKNPYTDESLMGEIRDAWRADAEEQPVAASQKEPQSVQVVENFFASRRGVKTENEFSTFDRMTKPEIVERWIDEVDTFFKDSARYLDSDGNALPGKAGLANAFKRSDMEVCPTPAVLRMVGVKPLDIVISRAEMHKSTIRKHHITRDELVKLPEMLADPVCVLESDTPGCVEVVTEMKENGVNVLVAIQLDTGTSKGKNAKVNRIASLYGKDHIRATLTHPRLYWNKAKARVWMHNARLQLPRALIQTAGSGKRVLKPDDLVNYKKQFNLDFSVSSLKERGEMPDGKLEAANGTLWDMSETDFAVFARHASPHSGIRKFLMQFIGTGEGAQAYGHGMYFSTSEGVHQSYVRQFTRGDRLETRGFFKDGTQVMPDSSLHKFLSHHNHRDPDKIKGWLPWHLELEKSSISAQIYYAKKYGDEAIIQKWTDAIDDVFKAQDELELLDRIEVQIVPGTPASEYEVLLNFERNGDNLLRWDEPVPDWLWEEVRDLCYSSARKPATGEGLYVDLQEGLGSKADATRALASAGIKGIEYRDWSSRGLEDGVTYNYVVFNEKNVKVVRVKDAETAYEWQDYTDTEADFSIAGMKARGASEYIGRGEDYIDKADGQRKFVIPNTEARLSTGFTMGQLNPPLGGHKDVSLPAVLHHPELYRNYPELAEMRVRFYRPKVDDECYGFFHPKDGEEAAFIALNMEHCKGDAGQVLNTLLHESQHAIQMLEGFSRGAGVFHRSSALAYLDSAIALRKKLGVDDEWSQLNMRYMKHLRARVANGDKSALMDVYFHARGEQEARFTGAGKGEAGENPSVGGKLTDGKHDSTTIAVTRDATELGGVTFLNMGRFGYLLESRLNPAGEFNYDRAVYQMKESITRRMRELKGLAAVGEADGLKLAAEGMATMDSVESLLPNSYRHALEPYKLYFSFYSQLHGTGSAARAAGVIPMKGWDKRMKMAMNKLAVEVLRGELRQADLEFWEGNPEALATVGRLADEFRQQVEARMQEMAAEGDEPGKVRTEAERRTIAENIVLNNLDEATVRELLSAIGEVRADKLMAKFLERVALQLDRFRKDKTLGRIRRVVDMLTPAPGKDGKPVKGRMDADSYRRVMDFVKLLELTRGERDRFFRTRYTGEEGTSEKAWVELDACDRITVDVFDADGEPVTLTCTKGEFEAYACYDAMTAAQAEAASRALGEFISTGRQAWENAEEAARQRIADRCAPLLEAYDETLNEYDERKNKRQRSLGGGRKLLEWLGWTMNDAQFFDALTGVKEIEPWAREFTDRLAAAHTYMEVNEKQRQAFLMGAVACAAGSDSPKDVRAFLDEINRTQDSGVVLVPREPDFLGQELETVRRQFLGVLHRKTHEKNFRPNTFAEALRTLTEKGEDVIPPSIAQEAWAKYGTIGNAEKSVLKGELAVFSLFTEKEAARFRELSVTAKERAEKAREKWAESEQGERMAQGVIDAEAEGSRRMSRAQAAYHVLMTEQADYAEMLRLQGYDEAAVEALKRFAGDDVMELAYALRDELGARTEQVKEMYERVYGMPFPEVENYFRAFFDVGQEQKENTVLDNQGYGSAAGGGAAKVLYTRQHHNQRIDPTMNILNAFNAAMKQQDVLLGYGDLPSDLMRVLNYREDNHRTMAHALGWKIGEDALRELREHAVNMTRLIPETEAVAGKLAVALHRLSSASAVSILNYRLGSLMKQGTAVFNSFAGSDMVNAWEWDKSAARVTAGVGKISLKELAARPELASRFKGWSAGADQTALRALRDVKTGHGATDAKVQAGMPLMEWVDMRANVRSSAILYDAVYRKLEKSSPEMTHAELDEAAMMEVRRALALKSQPLDWRSRSLMASKRSVFKMGSLFLGGESINTFGNVARLLARGKKGDWRRAAAVWLRHGAALQALTFLYNFLTDDEDMWERRSAYGYLTGTLLGPLAGIPFVSQVVSGAIGGVNHFLPKEYRAWMPTASLLPMGDIERTLRDWKKWDKGSWEDRCIIVENTVRALAGIGAACFSEPTTAGGARAKAVSYSVAAASNLVDFLLRATRAADERL